MIKKMIKKIIVKLNLINLLSIFFYIFRICKVKKNKIVFMNFSGKGYGDNLKYIYLELNKSHHDFDYVWIIGKNIKNNHMPDNIRTVRFMSIRSFYEIATAKIWINNSRFDQFVKKRKNQVYIQTWHGGIALKKIEYDAYEKLSDYYHRVMRNDNKMIDAMISNCRFCENMYRNGFKYKGRILKIGSPRNDILVNLEEKEKSEILKKLEWNKEEKYLLYAPTFRKSYDRNPYDIDFKEVKQKLEDSTGFHWNIVIRLHPRIKEASKYIKNLDQFIDATSYDDVQELIAVCDLLITDYSSTMFEAMIADKKVILYANDIESYEDERGMYFKWEELPFPLCKNQEELMKAISRNQEICNEKDINYFKEKIGLYENGLACKKIVEYIMERIEK